jgi:hypothetical protein
VVDFFAAMVLLLFDMDTRLELRQNSPITRLHTA